MVKKVVSISLIALLLLNTIGYYGLFLGLRYQASRQAVARIDAAKYSEDDVFTVKVPINVPYQERSSDYVRVNGEFEYQGHVYRMVKQKLDHDTLYVVCYHDTRSGAVKLAAKDYVKTFTDKAQTSKHQKLTLQFSGDYIPTNKALIVSSEGWHHDQSFNAPRLAVVQDYSSTTAPPPKA